MQRTPSPSQPPTSPERHSGRRFQAISFGVAHQALLCLACQKDAPQGQLALDIPYPDKLEVDGCARRGMAGEEVGSLTKTMTPIRCLPAPPSHQYVHLHRGIMLIAEGFVLVMSWSCGQEQWTALLTSCNECLPGQPSLAN